jgi:serine/threonine protein kinase
MDGSNPEESLFSRALEINPGPEREAWLDQQSGNDPALRQRVGELLRTHAAMQMEGDQAGHRLGLYELVEKIGKGAFGSVWRARQKQPVHREVALKILHRGMDTEQVTRRIAAERQVLALLEHENIASIFDAGVSRQGRPYFVMELVRGPKITDYCDQRRLGTKARLQLFTQVCRAVQYAHDQGILHRAIKPANIRVVEHRGIPTPKIIDFGIATASHGRLTEDTLVTADGPVRGMLCYMSPEQTAVPGLEVDARSDIYSLGALLYELLTGQPPVTEGEFKQMFFDEVVRTIRKKHPMRPSERVAALPPKERAVVAEQRDTEAETLPGLLARDLDWVVLRCLEKDPRHRYQKAGELAEGIQRHVEGRSRPETGLRLRYWLRRL